MVRLPFVLEMSSLLPNYDDKEAAKYVLLATINFLGRSANAGHYIAYLFNKDDVLVCDDKSLLFKKTEDVLQNKSFQQSICASFYISKKAFYSNTVDDVFLLGSKDYTNIQSLWLHEVPSSVQLHIDDVLSVVGDNPVKGDVIWAFLDIICEQSTYNVKAYSTRLFDNITRGRLNAEYQVALDSTATLNNDVLLIPIFHDVGHWSLAVVYPRLKIILHFDSKHQLYQQVFDGVLFFLFKCHITHGLQFSHSEWTLIATKQIPYQFDDKNCGVYVCVNGFNCIKFQFHPYTQNDMCKLRYWILHNAVKFTSKPSGDKERGGNIRIVEKPTRASRKVLRWFGEERSYYGLFEKLQHSINSSKVEENVSEKIIEEGEVKECFEEVTTSDEEKNVVDKEVTSAIQFFKRSKVYITSLIYNADKEHGQKSERLTALYLTDCKEFKNRSINAQMTLMENLGEDIYTALHKCAYEQFTVKSKSDDLYSPRTHLFKFNTSYGRLTTNDFYEYVVFPEMVLHWIESDKSLTYGEAEKSVYGCRPFHEIVLLNVSHNFLRI